MELTLSPADFRSIESSERKAIPVWSLNGPAVGSRVMLNESKSGSFTGAWIDIVITDIQPLPIRSKQAAQHFICSFDIVRMLRPE